MSHLSVRGVVKAFADFIAVHATSLDIAEGEFITFLGPSGSGKSTMLNMIAGIEQVSSGDIWLQGSTLLTVPPHKRNIGMVFQRYTLVPHMTVRGNIGFPLKVRRWARDRVDARVREMLDLVKLEGFADRYPVQLSGGQQQRVALARALAYHPRILLMDEPLAALDKKLKEGLQTEIKRIHRETGVTIVYVTHDQEEALRLSDRIAVFNKGRIEQVASPSELYEHPASRFVGSFIGNSIFIDIVIDRDGSARLPDGSVLKALVVPAAAKTGDEYEILLRPERISIGRTASPDLPGLPVTIREFSYLGETVDVEAVTSWGSTISARVASADMAGSGLAKNVAAFFRWPKEHGILFRKEG